MLVLATHESRSVTHTSSAHSQAMRGELPKRLAKRAPTVEQTSQSQRRSDVSLAKQEGLDNHAKVFTALAPVEEWARDQRHVTFHYPEMLDASLVAEGRDRFAEALAAAADDTSSATLADTDGEMRFDFADAIVVHLRGLRRTAAAAFSLPFPRGLDTHPPRELRLRLVVAAHPVPVDAENERGVLVAELVHHRARVYAERHEQRRERVSELVRCQPLGQRHRARRLQPFVCALHR